MKKVLVGAIGAVALGLSAPASAADLAARPYVKAPPPIAAIYDWSGFYIGINGGGGSSRTCWDFLDTTALFGVAGARVAEGCHNATGGTVGGQVGYRWQSASWVFGIEGQGNWADFTGDNISNITVFGTRNRSRIDAFGLITGQIGYAWNNVLFYVKGGGAVVGDRYDVFVGPGFTNTGALVASANNQNRWGGTVGAGLEVGFAPNWSVGVEYNHIFLGNHNVDFFVPGAGGVVAFSDNISRNVDMGLVRVNYRFGGPIIAKY
jgi:outer membrane immunogenic protein